MSLPQYGYSGEDAEIEKKGTRENDIEENVVTDASTEDPHMHRSLKGRHVSMIAIAGTIGTGLFLGSGRAISNGGPVGALIGYTIVGLLVGCMMFSLGEMMCYDPSAGGFIEFTARYVDPAAGFAVGWQFWFQTGMTAAVEVVAAAIVISYWDDNSKHLPIYITVMLLGMIAINFAGVKYFGEFEFWFAFIKISAVLGLILFCFVVDLGGGPDKDRRGFRNWKRAPFNNNYLGLTPPGKARFLGFWAVLTQASFSYGGMEGLASICLEAENPRKTMRTAVRAIFYRIVGLYILAIFAVGLVLPRDDPNLIRANAEGAGNAAQSPFVIVIKLSGVKVLDHIINAVVLTSAFSSGNEFLYASSRALFMLSQQGQAPRIFGRILPNGVPVFALGVSSLFSLLSYLSVSDSAEVAFNWLGAITTLGSQITWMNIAVAFLKLYYGMKKQGIPRSTLPFTSWIQPYGAWAVLVGFAVISFFAGWTSVRNGFAASDFFSTYVNILFVIILYVGYKFVKKSKWVTLDEMDCSTHYVEGSVVVNKWDKN